MSKQPRLFGAGSFGKPNPRILLATKIVADTNRRFPTNEDCILEICRRIVQSGKARCFNCNSNEFDREKHETEMTCRRCGTRRSCTLGTPFYRAHRPRAWLLRMTLLEEGVIVNGEEFGRLAKISGSTARNMMHQISSGLVEQMNKSKESTRSVPSSVLGPVVCRRTRLTPIDEHPRCEEDAFEQANLDTTRSPQGHAAQDDRREFTEGQYPAAEQDPAGEEDAAREQDGSSDPIEQREQEDSGKSEAPSGLSEVAARVYAAIGIEPTPLDSVLLATSLASGPLCGALYELEEANLVETLFGNLLRRIPQDLRRHLLTQLSDDDINAALDCADFIRDPFRGIGRKYAQLYAAIHWWLKNLRHHDLFAICVDAPIKTYGDILAYVSPQFIELAA